MNRQIFSTANREVYLKKINNMTFGTSSQEGVVRGSRFYHQKLGITFEFPKGWVVKNTSTHLFIHNPANTLGIILVVEDKNIKQTSEAFFNERYSNIISASAAPLSSELSGWSGVTKAIKTPYGRNKARIGVIFAGKSIYKFLSFAKKANEFDSNDAIFLNAMNSLRFLRQDEHKFANSQMIKLVHVQEGETFATLAKKSSLVHHAEEILRLINGMYPAGEPSAGDLIKTIM